MLRRLSLALFLLTAVVVVFGAYVRLSDAGLGCPDWPGCYGELTPHHAAEEIIAEHMANPSGPVSMAKAWKEMIHRYLASGIGLLIMAIAFLAWRRRERYGLPVALFWLVCLQGAFGAWTVTMRLMPVVVTTHLLLGMGLLGLVCWLALREWQVGQVELRRTGVVRLGLVLLFVQIALGGWVSTNYVALACIDFPTCHGAWVPADMDFSGGFSLLRELGLSATGEALPAAALVAIHWAHRLGALLIGGYLIWLGIQLVRQPALRANGWALIAGVLLQIALGIANVLMMLPIPLAVGHNAGAALLVMLMVWTNYRVRPLTVLAGETGHARLAT